VGGSTFLRLVPFLGYNACLPQSNPSLDFFDQIKVSFLHMLRKLLTRKREKHKYGRNKLDPKKENETEIKKEK